MRAVRSILGLVCLGISFLGAGVAHSQTGQVVAWGGNDCEQTILPAPNANFIAVAAGDGHSLGLNANGSIVAWGANGCGQCDVPEPNADFVAVAAGWHHSMGLKTDGTIVAWGCNDDGQLDVPFPNLNFVAIVAGDSHNLGLKSDSTIVAWGNGDFGQTTEPSPNGGFVGLAAGWHHSLGLKADGTVVSWGYDGDGQGDVPAPNTDFVAIAAGGAHNLGLKVDGSIVAWGDSTAGQCDVPAPNTDFEAIAAGGAHSLGLKADGSIVAWGGNDAGQIDAPMEPGFVVLAGGSSHSLAVRSMFTVTRNTVGAGVILVAPDSATYALGDTMIVTAMPDPGWSFSGWSGGLSGAENPDTIIVASDTSITATFVPDQYTFSTATVGNGQIVEVPDSATYVYGDTVIVTAVPDTHWAFAGWSGGLSGLENPDTVVIVGDTSVTATFEQVAFVVTRNTVGSGVIQTDPDSATYALGDTVVVTAIPDPGWSFGGWSGGLSGAENPDTIIVASDTSITATFTQDQFDLGTSTVGNGQIIVDPDSATYVYGDTVVVTAVADPGWSFTGWSGGLSGAQNPDTLIVASDTSITATFTQDQYTVNTSTVGNGQIAEAPDSATYVYGDTVVVTAVADPGWSFTGWSGGLSGAENPDTVIIASDTSITATFTPDQFVLGTSTVGDGVVTVDPDSATYVYGDTVIVTAVPDTNWAFAGWSGGLSGLENPDTVVIVGDTSVTATFEQVAFVVTRNTVGSGVIQVDPDSATYALGDTVVVTAIPDPGWSFSGWSGGLSGAENPDTVIIASDTSITATFTPDQFVLGTSAVGNGQIIVDPDSATYVYGDTVIVTAVPDTHWAFAGWSDGLSGIENPDTVVVVGDTSVTATFEQVAFVVTRNTVGSGVIQADPDSVTYALGDTVIVTAVPDPGWSFVGWSGGLSGLENPDTVIIASDTSITATFTQDQFVLGTSTVGNGQIIVDPDSATYVYGDTVVVTAVADPGWSFAGWSEGLSGAQNPDTLIIASDTSITATFTQDQYTVNTSTVGNGQITEAPDSAMYVYGDTVTVTAVPDVGWSFAGWSGGLSGAENPDTIIVASDTSITATFTPDQFVLGTSTVGNGQIVVDPDSATHVYGDTVTVTAVPDTNWAFAGWSEGLSGLENPDTVVIVGDTSVTATFEQVAFVVTRNTVGSGVIQADPDSATYALGDTVVVTAIPDPGWSFGGWSGGLSGAENPDTIIVASDTSITATFTQSTFTIATNVIGSGQVVLAPDQIDYVYGDTVFVTAIPDTGWSFVAWTAGLSGSENPDTIIVAADTSITATFVEAQTQYTLSTGVIGSGQVSVTPDQGSYLYGDTVIVAAVPDTGWVFDTWSGALTGDENPDTLVITVDTTLTATFVPIQYAIDITTVGSGSVTRAPNQATYAFGDTVILTAVPDSAWSFKEWTGALTGAENPDTVVVDTVLAITATFDPTPTAIGATSTPRFVAVQQNFPNPFGLGTTIRYGLPAAERATLEVYDVRGRLVARHDLPQRGAGWHEYRFEARDNSGRPLASGVYFYRLKTPGAAVTRKMVIAR